MSAPTTITPGCQLWPVDGECLPAGWTENPALWPPDQVRAVMLASDWLHNATGKAYGVCLEYIRPCRRRCSEPSAGGLPGGAPFQPVLWDGRVINITCGCTGECGCGPLCEIPLPGDVHSIAAVKVDGLLVDPNTYRVDNRRRLVRTGGLCWPDCQNLALPESEPGTFAVWYWTGRDIPPLGRLALTTLAVEFAKFCAGDDNGCRISQRVTEITRQGMAFTIENATGATNIKLVDDWVALVNPYGNTEPGISVWTPDLDYGRAQTWPHPFAEGVNPPLNPFAYRHVQPTAATVWTIAHNLGWYPGGVQVEGPNGETIGGVAVSYPDTNTVRLTFNTPMSGVAYLS